MKRYPIIIVSTGAPEFVFIEAANWAEAIMVAEREHVAPDTQDYRFGLIRHEDLHEAAGDGYTRCPVCRVELIDALAPACAPCQKETV